LNDQGHTILLITHDHEVAAQAKRIVEIRDGLIISDREQPAPEAIVPPVTPPIPPKRPQRGRGSGYGLLDVTEACRSEEHTSELQSLMRTSYAALCLKKK